MGSLRFPLLSSLKRKINQLLLTHIGGTRTTAALSHPFSPYPTARFLNRPDLTDTGNKSGKSRGWVSWSVAKNLQKLGCRVGFNLPPYRLITFATNDNLSHVVLSSLCNWAEIPKFFKKCSRCVAFCCERSIFISETLFSKTLEYSVFTLTQFSRLTDKELLVCSQIVFQNWLLL
jgi:hypothetical protein